MFHKQTNCLLHFSQFKLVSLKTLSQEADADLHKMLCSLYNRYGYTNGEVTVTGGEGMIRIIIY